MLSRISIIVFVFSVVSLTVSFSVTVAQQPVVYNLNGELLQKSKLKIQEGDPELLKAVRLIIQQAEESLKTEMLSVVSKPVSPSSGDKHDYMSIGPYWWPNPKTKDGLPYIRRDGEVNPEYRTFGDAEKLQTLANSVNSLALAYYFTGNEKFAGHAASLLRHWFIEGETRMNPNLNYGQSVPGVTPGRGYGVIETRGLLDIIDGIGLIGESVAWSHSDQKAMENWISQYLAWLQESKLGLDESKAPNNHGTYYDVQCVTYALFTKQTGKARDIIENKTKQRLATQIKEDGSQPSELSRTQSWSYSNMNLKGFFMLAHLANQVGIDLGNFSVDGKKPLQLALDYFIPYLKKEKTWEKQQLSTFKYNDMCYSLQMAGLIYGDKRYEKLASDICSNQKLFSLNLPWPFGNW